MKRTAVLALALLAACHPPLQPGPAAAPSSPSPASPPPAAPAPGSRWVLLTEAQGEGGIRRIYFDSASVRPVEEEAREALARIDYATPQEQQGTRYTQEEMRIRFRCGPPSAVVTMISDTLRMEGRVVGGHEYGGTEWAPVREDAGPGERWPLEICRILAGRAPPPEIPAQLAAARAGYVSAWQAHDLGAISAFFAGDARVVFPDRTLEGRERIERQWIAEDVGKVSELVMTPRHTDRIGDEFTESGTVTLRFAGAGGTREERGTYEHVWARQPDGSWKLKRVRMETHPAP